LFPGQDYNNARVLDFQQVDHYVNTQISALEIGRMPWHDVHMTLIGPVVLDIVQHFIERWNEVKLRKVRLLLIIHLHALTLRCSTRSERMYLILCRDRADDDIGTLTGWRFPTTSKLIPNTPSLVS
jgi:phosphatidylserine/phosphatidylglycerophosphate/cardiolipin synthase-like enzyme